jgi:hypothetical protein
MARREAEKLRRELDSVVGRQGRCFSWDLKDRAARWLSARRAEGASVAELAAELGLAEGTVLRWSARSAQPQPRALVPVTVVSDGAIERRLSVVSPSGFRGLSCTFSGFAAQQIVGKLPTFPGAGKGRQGAG